VAGSLLQAAGLPELVTGSLAEYEALALRLATTPSLLAGYRARLEAQRANCPLFDTDRFRRHLEAAYVEMVARQRRGEPPAGFDVAPIG
jgi:predicted O-linked N-acetylglucosamine transferase (SPINDLY family)